MEEAKATSQRLDPKCWKGKHKEGTKVKNGVRVNNCVPIESIEENAWSDGSNAWSSEHDQWAKESIETEGWSDAIVAQRTGQPRTPYSVYIKGKKWKDFENDDHAEAVANKLRAKFKADGRDPSVITIAPTDYDKMAEATNRHFGPKGAGMHEAKWDPWTGGDFGDDHDMNHLPSDGAEKPGAPSGEQFKAMIQYYGNDMLVKRALMDLYSITHGEGVMGTNNDLKVEATFELRGKTEVRYFRSKKDAYNQARAIGARVVSIKPIESDLPTNLITLPVMLGLGDHKKKWMLQFPDERIAQKWEFQHKNAAQIMWPNGHGLAEDATDSKSWMAQVKAKYPTVKFIQAKMPGAPIRAYVDGKVVAEFKQGAGAGNQLAQQNRAELDRNRIEKHTPKKNEFDIKEAGSPAQQAAIAIAKKKEQGVAEEQKPGFGEFPAKQEITIIPPKKLKSGETYQDRNKYWQSQGQAPIYKTNEDEGDCEGLPHLTKELLTHIVDQVGTEGAHAIIKSLEWGDGAAEELLALILKDLKADIGDEEIAEHIGRVKGGFRLYSHKGKNLGTFPSKAGAEKHEREVQYFQHAKEGVAEGHTDQQRKIFKKNGKPVGEVGIDRESSPGNGQWYMKCYAYNIDNAGYDSYEEAVAELKHCMKQGVAEAQTDYQKRRQRERDVDAGKPVAKQRTSKMTDYQKRRAQQKREMELGENTNYWTRLQNERSTKLNSLVNELKESIKK